MCGSSKIVVHKGYKCKGCCVHSYVCPYPFDDMEVGDWLEIEVRVDSLDYHRNKVYRAKKDYRRWINSTFNVQINICKDKLVVTRTL